MGSSPKSLKDYTEIIVIAILSVLTAKIWYSIINQYLLSKIQQNFWLQLLVGVISTLFTLLIFYLFFSQ